MRRTSVLALPLVLGALTLGVAACGGGGGSASTMSSGGSTSGSGSTAGAPPAAGTTTIAGATANVHGTKDVSGLGQIDMELDDFYFGPTVLQGTPGQKLEIELENEGSTEHNFTIDAQSVDQDVEAGQKATVSVTFPRSGVLQFYCEYHKQLGMVGEIATAAR